MLGYNISMRISTNKGQALVEYLLVVIFLIILTFKIVTSFTTFMAESMGNLGHVLSKNLQTGICKKECFYDGYANQEQ